MDDYKSVDTPMAQNEKVMKEDEAEKLMKVST